jgi:hypothetical protein
MYASLKLQVRRGGNAMDESPNEFSGVFGPGGKRAQVVSDGSQGRSSTKTLAIVLLVLGSLGLINSVMAPLSAAMMFFIAEATGGDEAQVAQLKSASKQLFSPIGLVMLFASFALSVALVAGAIGTLKKRLWGAVTLARACLATAIWMLIALPVNIYNQFGVQNDVMASMKAQSKLPNGQELPEDFGMLFQGFFAVAAAMGVLFALVCAVFYLWSFLHLRKPSSLTNFQ